MEKLFFQNIFIVHIQHNSIVAEIFVSQVYFWLLQLWKLAVLIWKHIIFSYKLVPDFGMTGVTEISLIVAMNSALLKIIVMADTR